uniref:Uncharacterized protein n=1 Tax=Panagrolaimus sp. JU765 TaxID=591449 RepID=A0AC34R0A5_9BILA
MDIFGQTLFWPVFFSQTTSFLFEYKYGWNTWQNRKELQILKEKLNKEDAEHYQKLKDDKRKITFIKQKVVKKKSSTPAANKTGEEKTPDYKTPDDK